MDKRGNSRTVCMVVAILLLVASFAMIFLGGLKIYISTGSGGRIALSDASKTFGNVISVDDIGSGYLGNILEDVLGIDITISEDLRNVASKVLDGNISYLDLMALENFARPMLSMEKTELDSCDTEDLYEDEIEQYNADKKALTLITLLQVALWIIPICLILALAHTVYCHITVQKYNGFLYAIVSGMVLLVFFVLRTQCNRLLMQIPEGFINISSLELGVAPILCVLFAVASCVVWAFGYPTFQAASASSTAAITAPTAPTAALQTYAGRYAEKEAEGLTCPVCGASAERGDLYCQTCGASLTGVKKEAPRPVTPPMEWNSDPVAPPIKKSVSAVVPESPVSAAMPETPREEAKSGSEEAPRLKSTLRARTTESSEFHSAGDL